MKDTVDTTVFTVFYRRHYSLALTIAQQRLGGLSDPEGITAEAFRIAWAHHREGQQLTLPWLYQVVRNLIGNEYRRLARADGFAQAVSPLMEEQSAETSSDDVLEIRSGMQRLPTKARELLYMAYWEGLSSAEIGEILGIRDSAVRLRLMRARRMLRKMLDNRASEVAKEVNKSDGRD